MLANMITTAFVAEFRDAVFPLAQQSESRFRGKCVEQTITGEEGYIEQLGPEEAVDVTTRHADTPILNSEWYRRRVTLTDADWGDLVDKQDRLRMLVDPMSAYTQNARRAMARKWDSRFVNALFATAWTGKNGTAQAPWPAGPGGDVPPGYQVGVSSWAYGNGEGVAGMTLSKIIEARVALLGKEAIEDGFGNTGDSENEAYLALTSIEIGQLLATTEVTCKDFGVSRDELVGLSTGKVDRLLGFEVVRYEKMPLTTDGNGYRRCTAWVKSGMGFGVGSEKQAWMNPRWDKRGAIQVYASEATGASRLEEAKVVEIICNE